MENKTAIAMTQLVGFKEYLLERENAPATLEKYLRDVRKFFAFAGEGSEITKEKLLIYKERLMEGYSVSSVNSMLVALNQFLGYMGLGRLRLKRVRVQRIDLEHAQKALGKEEFRRLVRTARDCGKEQLAMIMETMCATGIRVSELKYFRVENLRSGIVKVWNKGKYRMVILPALLKNKKKRDQERYDFLHQVRPGEGPLQYLAGNEGGGKVRRHRRKKGISPQSAASLCPILLRKNQESDYSGGYTGPQQPGGYPHLCL